MAATSQGYPRSMSSRDLTADSKRLVRYKKTRMMSVKIGRISMVVMVSFLLMNSLLWEVNAMEITEKQEKLLMVLHKWPFHAEEIDPSLTKHDKLVLLLDLVLEKFFKAALYLDLWNLVNSILLLPQFKAYDKEYIDGEQEPYNLYQGTWPSLWITDFLSMYLYFMFVVVVTRYARSWMVAAMTLKGFVRITCLSLPTFFADSYQIGNKMRYLVFWRIFYYILKSLLWKVNAITAMESKNNEYQVTPLEPNEKWLLNKMAKKEEELLASNDQKEAQLFTKLVDKKVNNWVLLFEFWNVMNTIFLTPRSKAYNVSYINGEGELSHIYQGTEYSLVFTDVFPVYLWIFVLMVASLATQSRRVAFIMSGGLLNLAILGLPTFIADFLQIGNLMYYVAFWRFSYFLFNFMMCGIRFANNK